MSHRSGLTLIELLAVLVITAITFATGLAAVNGVRSLAALEQTVSDWREFDRTARITARGTGVSPFRPVRLRVGDAAIELINPNADSRTMARPISSGVHAQLLLHREPATIRFDKRGVSEDYIFKLTDARGASRAYAVSGLTGWIERIDREVTQ